MNIKDPKSILLQKIIQKYNITTCSEEIADPRYDFFFKAGSVSSILYEVDQIFASSKNKYKKQEEIESLSHTFSKKVVNSNYILSPTVTKKLDDISAFFVHKKDCRLHDPLYISTQQLQCRRTFKKEALEKYNNLFLKIYDTPKELSLDLIKIVCTHLRNQMTSDSCFKNIQNNIFETKGNLLKRKSRFFSELQKGFEVSNPEENIDLNIIQIKLTNFLSLLSSDFLKSCKFRYILSQIEECKEKLLNKLKKINLSSIEYKEIVDSVNASLKDEPVFQYDEKQQVFIGEILINILAKVGFVCIEQAREFNLEDPQKTKRQYPVYVASFSVEILKGLFHIVPYDASLPMIVPPLNWKETITDNDSDNQINCGGFLFNETLSYPAVHMHSKEAQSFVGTENLQNLNYLQGIAFQINKTALEFVKTNLDAFLIDYLNNLDLNYDSIITISKSNINIRSYTSYLDSLPTNPGIPQGLQEKFLAFNKLNYTKVLNAVIRFLFTLELSERFIDETLYFKLFLDWRGRIYYQSYPLSPQGDSISKFLIKFKDEKESEIYDLERFLSIKNGKLIKTLVEDGSLESQSLDASCSGISILSGLIGDLDGLISTNVFVEDIKVHSVKQDLYSEVQQRILSYIDSIKTQSDLGYYSDVFNRNNTKQLVMCWAYSEGEFSRLKKIMNWLRSSKNKYFNSVIEREITEEDEDIVDYIKTEFVTFINKDLAHFNEFLINMFKLLKKDTSNPMFAVSTFSSESFLSIINISKQKEAQTVSYINGKAYKLVVLQSTDAVDTRKLVRGLIPNFVHSIDAALLNRVLTDLRLCEIPVITSHDCFRVPKQHAELVKSRYFHAFNELLLKDNSALLLFLSVNGISLFNDLERNEYHLQLLHNKEKIQNRYLYKHTLFSSPYILS